ESVTSSKKFEFYDALQDQREFENRNPAVTSDVEPAMLVSDGLTANTENAQAILDTSPRLEEVELPQGSFMLQAASFRDFGSADETRARLELQGFSPSISRAQIREQLWYRVQVGPFYGERSAKEAERILKQNGFKPIVLKF
ncbi:MAG: SPOR domain-containing protein, partial [Pseudomonadota bacterium]